ncbi:hypothetical protein KBC14_03510 [Candidatus Woesebacteria bacterium]|nr:hypothetical protein [Candidatus Woesebacteria bacterium]MBP6883431.1 hypothetical protein [Candidatus Woesebacteria bacterium]
MPTTTGRVIVSSTFMENSIKINTLRKKQAILTRRIIEGLRMFIQKDIDTSEYSVLELVNQLKELSKTETIL